MDRRRWLMGAASCGVVGLGCGGCKTAPITGRRQLMMIPEQNEVAMGLEAFEEVSAEEPAASNPRFQAMVERVARRLADASGRTDYNWETRVVASDDMNAYALPGGKIVVYEGILPICQNEAGLAVVMGHEVAHVLARHGGERMSQQSAVNGVKTVVGYAMRNKEQVTKDMWLQAYGLATEYGLVLPYSRKHETEADHIGLMLMADAGYDPAQAPKFWMRFAQAAKGPKPPEFLSTHPADERRASDLEKLLPEALQEYRQAEQQIGTGELLV